MDQVVAQALSAFAAMFAASARTPMPEAPFVSALMAAYNAEPFIAEAIESALAQDWPASRLEVVVCDDGSTDGTAAVVEGFAERHPGRVRLDPPGERRAVRRGRTPRWPPRAASGSGCSTPTTRGRATSCACRARC